MAEEANKEGEGIDLNSIGEQPNKGDGGDQKPEWGEKTTFTLEEVDAMKKKWQADTEKGVQKIITEKTTFEKALDEVGKISDDPKRLVVLHETEPELAKMILKKYYHGQTIDQYMDEQGIELDLSDPEIVKKRVSLEAQKIADERVISEKKDEFIEQLKMSDEEKTQFEEAFEERRNLKSFDPKEVRKHLEKAYREVNDSFDPSKLKNAETIANALWSGSGKWAGGSSGGNGTNPTKASVEWFLDTYL